MRLLSEGDDGTHHQRFVLRIAAAQTLLIAHNVEVAGRVPLSLGDRVRFRGIYEWNDLGGMVHWTHTDPLASTEGGWIEFRGQRYR